MTDTEHERPDDDDPEPDYDPHPLEGGQTDAVDDAQEEAEGNPGDPS